MRRRRRTMMKSTASGLRVAAITALSAILMAQKYSVEPSVAVPVSGGSSVRPWQRRVEDARSDSNSRIQTWSLHRPQEKNDQMVLLLRGMASVSGQEGQGN